MEKERFAREHKLCFCNVQFKLLAGNPNGSFVSGQDAEGKEGGLRRKSWQILADGAGVGESWRIHCIRPESTRWKSQEKNRERMSDKSQ